MIIEINKAYIFANYAHKSIDQKRKYTNEPYIVHPKNVAYLVEMVGGTEDMINAAFLHDILEDVSPINPAFGEHTIKQEFGEKVLKIVKCLTDISKPEDGNRQIRKEIERNNIALQSKEVKTIKLADLIDNSSTITKYDKNFSRIYLKEKRLLLEVLKEGNNNLWNIANDILLREGY